ncbi:outer membrane beta-barrel protein [Bradyrhizobium sp.]|uniref:outer membrane protein n=1 Tax=Bradyrhizobium sp. TaxID=376 RepID=UPI0025BA67ED|nr:outer membrane beta-barrel protein [Bradyrhizobium sp.]
MMKRTQKLTIAGTAALAALAFAGAALAADLPARTYAKAPMVSPVYSWTGFYVGGHVGAGWGTTETDLNVGALVNGFLPNAGLGLNLPIGQTQLNGFLGGAQAGYNWQAGMMVFGVEGDFTWSGLKGGTTCLLVIHCDAEVKWIGDVTGRVGATVGDRGLVYIKGGGAWADSKYLVNQNVTVGGIGGGLTGTLDGSVSKTRFGGVLGAGIEYGFMPNWSAKLEYDYFDFGKTDLSMPVRAAGAIANAGGSASFNLPINVNQQIHTIRVGANYHF